MRAIEILETERLTGRPPKDGDVDLLHGLHRDPRAMATLGGLRDAEQTRFFLEMFIDHWRERGFGTWMLFDRESGAFAGRAGLRRLEILGRPEVEVLYALLPDFWGRGLATEVARASVEAAFRDLRLEALIALALQRNAASQRVMQKAGFRYDRDFTYADRPHVLYRLSKESLERPQ
ncbi:MAG: GNAT family N-acetyltransferase [Kiloniellales bacterium]|nr:GNAT family N-acetyltransferase [Kiloniellales bacterium]